MNEQLLNDELLDSGTEMQRKRPVFLLVLCILTFVGAGLGLLGAIFSVFTMSQTEEVYSQMNSFGTDIGIDFRESYKWTKIANYANLVGNALCLTGALFMFQLKKIGFYVYIPGQMLPLIGAYLAMNSMFTGGLFAGIGMVSMVFNTMIAIAFIVMYGLNLKHMK